MLPTGVKNRLFFNSVDFSIFQICAQLCSHTACSLLIILQGALRKQSFFYAIFNSQNNIASMRRYPELFVCNYSFENMILSCLLFPNGIRIQLKERDKFLAVQVTEKCKMLFTFLKRASKTASAIK